jgi:hypothetical protein
VRCGIELHRTLSPGSIHQGWRGGFRLAFNDSKQASCRIPRDPRSCQDLAPLLPRGSLWGARRAASSTRPPWTTAAGLTMKSVGKPDAGNPHVRFDERGGETGQCHRALPRLYHRTGSMRPRAQSRTYFGASDPFPSSLADFQSGRASSRSGEPGLTNGYWHNK